MKANELRIGNWVEITDSIRKVETISEDGINYNIYGGFICWENTIRGIPLTPEILEKCGFVDQGRLMADENDVWVSVPEMTVGLYMQPGEQDFHISVRYVHQLQNLYFALTGEELNVEL